MHIQVMKSDWPQLALDPVCGKKSPSPLLIIIKNSHMNIECISESLSNNPGSTPQNMMDFCLLVITVLKRNVSKMSPEVLLYKHFLQV